jgi:hypothetical protein
MYIFLQSQEELILIVCRFEEKGNNEKLEKNELQKKLKNPCLGFSWSFAVRLFVVTHDIYITAQANRVIEKFV